MNLSKQRALSIFADVAAATCDGIGVTRESFGIGEEKAIQVLERHVMLLGLCSTRDALQNLWITLDNNVSDEPYIIIGSHVDSVPLGGNFDGLAGVVAGMLVLLNIKERALLTKVPVKVLALRGEESAWYGKAYIGSSALLGKLDVRELANLHRSGQGSLSEAMLTTGVDLSIIQAGKAFIDMKNVLAFLELHIEQGPVMVARQWPIAVVTGIRGNIRHNLIRCIGETGHSGAVPRWLRKDAMLAVAELLSRMDEHWRVLLQMGMDLVMTAGICTTTPSSHAVSVIPGEVQFSFEVRSQDADTLERFYTLMQEECESIGRARQVIFEFDRKIATAAASMAPEWIARFKQSAAARGGVKLESIPSGAGHDAAVFANAGIPSAMIFVRNENGSHNPKEAMDMDDFLIGVTLLADGICDL